MPTTNSTDNVPEESPTITIEIEINPYITHEGYIREQCDKLRRRMKEFHAQLSTIQHANGKVERVNAGPADPFLALYNKPKRKPNLADYSYPSDNSPKGFKNGPGPIGN
jgi:hypothetical protein